jgi:fibronectin-binding autotransporter adhesin
MKSSVTSDRRSAMKQISTGRLSRTDAARAAARLRFAAQGRLAALAIGVSALFFSGSLLGANTEYDVTNGQTNLNAPGTYTTGGTPGTGAGGMMATTGPTVASDVTFDSGTYTTTAFTLGSAATFGSLDDLSSTPMTISGTALLTLGGAGDLGDSVPGSAAADLFFVGTGANLTYSGAGGIALGQSGNFDIAGTAAISSVISGGFAITTIGAGTLTLSGSNTYSGGTNINAGTVSIGNANALGTGTISFGGGTLQYGTVNTDLSARFGTVGQSYNFDLGTNNVTFGTAFGGTGTNGNTLTKSGAGVLTLSSANTYTGDTTVNAGAIYINNNAGAGTGTITLAGTSALLFNNQNFSNPINVTGNNVILNQADNADGSHTGALTGAGTLTVPLSVVVNGTTYNGASSFKYNGDLSGFTGTFGDSTNKNVIFQGAANNGSGAKWVINESSGGAFVGSQAGTGGIFQMGELSGNSSSAVIYGNFNSGATITYQIGALNTNSTYAGQFQNSGSGVAAINKVGTGTLTLSGQNQESGADTITAGTLQFAKTQSLFNSATPTATNFIVKSGATAAFNVGGTGEFTAANIASIAALGTSTGGFNSGSFLALDTTNAGSFSYGTAITNTNGNANVLSLTKLGTGALSLTATSTYTGATTVAAGTLSLTGALGNTAVTVNSDATLAGSGNGTTTGLIGGTISALGGSSVTLATPGTQLKSTGAITLGNTGTYGSAKFASLLFTLGTTNTAEAFNTAGTLTANNVFVSLSSVTNGTYTLANYASVAAGYDFSLSSTTGNVLTENLGRTTETLTVGSTALTLMVSGLANPNVAYYNNAVGSGVWNDTSNATS